MSALLSRVAEDLYWAARYMERAEDTARIVREYTNLIIDLPTSVMSGWAPLLAIIGVDDLDEALAYSEHDVIDLLVSSPTSPSSILSCVELARNNLRSCREVIPTEAWFVVNDLHLYVAQSATDGLARRSRTRFLDRVIAEHQHLVGILAGAMIRDHAYAMLRLGRHVERADMTTRVLDVRAGALMADRPAAISAYDDVQWTSVLRSLSALQMYHRTRRQPVNGPTTVSFALHESRFPRSVAYCLGAAMEGIRSLPYAEVVEPAAQEAIQALRAFDGNTAAAADLHEMADELQRCIGALHERLAGTYFRGSSAPS